MPTETPGWKRWIGPIIAVVGLALVVFLSNRTVTTPEGLPVIGDADSWGATIHEAEELSKNHFIAADRGEELTDADRADLRKAAKLFDSANRFFPMKIGPFVGAGKAYQLTGELEAADERLRQAISNVQYAKTESDRNNVIEAQRLLSEVKARENDWDSAFKLADAAVKAAPNAPQYLATRASAEIQLKKLNEAAADIALALKLDPTNRDALRLKKLFDTEFGSTGH